jgi:hypothetical protein
VGSPGAERHLDEEAAHRRVCEQCRAALAGDNLDDLLFHWWEDRHQHQPEKGRAVSSHAATDSAESERSVNPRDQLVKGGSSDGWL